jgi:multidrug efflux pump subunit AcrA (membrane-fusion protein)
MVKIRYIKTFFIKNIKKHPLPSFYASLTLLLAVIALVSYLGRPAAVAPATEAPPKLVSIYPIGTPAYLTTTATVEKGGQVTIAAQTAGIVTSLPITTGQSVANGQRLLTISTTYSGGNLASQQLALAKSQLDFQTETAPIQQGLIDAQKAIAETTADNAEELRLIAAGSLDATRNQLSATQSIIDSLDKTISDLENTTGQETEILLTSTKQLRNQFLGAKNQLQTALNQTEYQTGTDNPPQELTRLAREVTLKQLDIQSRSLTLNQEVAKLNHRLAALTASLNYPAAPFSGIIEAVYVRYGQAVTPGTPLVTISGSGGSSHLLAAVPPEITRKLNQMDQAIIIINDQEYPLTLSHISSPLSDRLNRLTFSLPPNLLALVNDRETLLIKVPLGYPQTQASLPIIPVDSVHQTQESAYVFVLKNDRAHIQAVELGRVLGDQVEILSGLITGDLVIKERNISQDDLVTIDQ